MPKTRIVIVDDDRSLRELLGIVFTKEGFDVKVYGEAKEALSFIEKNPASVDTVITDIVMPEMDGIIFLERIKAIDADLPVIVITANTRVDFAVDALRKGAYDYITKPFENDEIRIIAKNAVEKRNLLKENIRLRSLVSGDSIVYQSAAMAEVVSKAGAASKSTASVLITGESGTGKELVAKLIHRESDRSDKTFFAVNCGAIPENLMESEFFGYEKGAFTGAANARSGYFELASGGTLFLDEIGELPMQLQVKLLRVLEDRSVLRLGAKEPKTVDFRVIAATNRQLEEEVKKGAFREDLFYRLNVVRLNICPVRERREDILPISYAFLKKYSEAAGRSLRGFTRDAIRFLEGYAWPGNVRELQNVIERACVLETGDIMGVGSLPVDLLRSVGNSGFDMANTLPDVDLSKFDLDEYLMNVERSIITKAMESNRSKKLAAEKLGISIFSLYRRLAKLGLSKDDPRHEDEK